MTDQQKAEHAALAAMPDDEIDTGDITEIPTEWASAKRGVFYGGKVVKQQVMCGSRTWTMAWRSGSRPTLTTWRAIKISSTRRCVNPSAAKKPATPPHLNWAPPPYNSPPQPRESHSAGNRRSPAGSTTRLKISRVDAPSR